MRSDSKMTFFGGPMDGQAVQLEPGWPPPDAMMHRDWPGGSYRIAPERDRYEWRQAAPRRGGAPP